EAILIVHHELSRRNHLSICDSRAAGTVAARCVLSAPSSGIDAGQAARAYGACDQKRARGTSSDSARVRHAQTRYRTGSDGRVVPQVEGRTPRGLGTSQAGQAAVQEHESEGDSK